MPETESATRGSLMNLGTGGTMLVDQGWWYKWLSKRHETSVMGLLNEREGERPRGSGRHDLEVVGLQGVGATFAQQEMRVVR